MGLELRRNASGESVAQVLLEDIEQGWLNLPQMLTGGVAPHVDPGQAVQELAEEARDLSREELIERVEQLASTLAA